MATHEELSLLRDARAGLLSAQLDLGKRYLRGSEGLPKNLEAALHWLGNAASQDSLDACVHIGRNIPYEIAKSSNNPLAICLAYERAFEAGETVAGLVLAKLVLNHCDQTLTEPFRQSAIVALRSAAHSGSHEAQWMWAEFVEAKGNCRDLALIWAERAARGGIKPAQFSMSEFAWDKGDLDAFLKWALPIAKSLQQASLARQRRKSNPPLQLSCQELKLLLRCGQALAKRSNPDSEDVKTFWKIAAEEGDIDARFFLGLLLARRQIDGTPTSVEVVSKHDCQQAIQWLTLAGKQGKKEAWFILSRIHENEKYVGANLELARHYRQLAAEMGHSQAQYECGVSAWSLRHLRKTNELRAVYWLELAEAQGCVAARELLAQIQIPPVGIFERTSLSVNKTENPIFTA